MNFKLSYLLAILPALIVFPTSSVATPGTSNSPKARAPLTCGNPASAIPLYRSYQPAETDHFYTTNLTEHTRAQNTFGYVDEGIAGYVFPAPQASLGLLPLYRAYHPDWLDHLYTTNATELSSAVSDLGYTDEGITGFVYPDGGCGGSPLWRLFSQKDIDHFYTTDIAEADQAVLVFGYVEQGSEGYIFAG